MAVPCCTLVELFADSMHAVNHQGPFSAVSMHAVNHQGPFGASDELGLYHDLSQDGTL